MVSILGKESEKPRDLCTCCSHPGVPPFSSPPQLCLMGAFSSLALKSQQPFLTGPVLSVVNSYSLI